MFQPPTLQWNLQNAQGLPVPGPSPLISPPDMKHGVKRKLMVTPETAVVPPPPLKHFVTEEEMTVEMRRLHIVEPQCVQYPQCTPYFQDRRHETLAPFTFNSAGQFCGFGFPYVNGAAKPINDDSEVEFNDIEGASSMGTQDGTQCSMEPQEEVLPRLFVSEEVLAISPPPALPPSLLSSLPSQRLALVPWVPPVLPSFDDENVEANKSENKEDMDMCC